LSGLTPAGLPQNSTLIRRDRAAAELAGLKQQPGHNTGITGSVTLAS